MFCGLCCFGKGHFLFVTLRTGDKLAMDAVTYKGIKTGIDFVATKMNKGKKPSKVLTTVAAVGATAMLSSQGVLPNSLVATAESVVGGVTGSKKLSELSPLIPLALAMGIQRRFFVFKKYLHQLTSRGIIYVWNIKVTIILYMAVSIQRE